MHKSLKVSLVFSPVVIVPVYSAIVCQCVSPETGMDSYFFSFYDIICVVLKRKLMNSKCLVYLQCSFLLI